MILLLESSAVTRKKLCDLLNKERIIGMDSGVRVFEMVCKYKKDINVIIASISLINNIVSNRILMKLCQKLAIEVPPILCYYLKKYEKIKQNHQRENKDMKFIELDISDETFPERFIKTLWQIYPELSADIERAAGSWLHDTVEDDPIDLQKWLVEQGFVKLPEEVRSQPAPDIHGSLGTHDDKVDYKKLYIDLKAKYDSFFKQ
jgi:hypothetical protein